MLKTRPPLSVTTILEVEKIILPVSSANEVTSTETHVVNRIVLAGTYGRGHGSLGRTSDRA